MSLSVLSLCSSLYHYVSFFLIPSFFSLYDSHSIRPTTSSLSLQTLKSIWSVCDRGNKGKLDEEEFLVAMQLTYYAKGGRPVPRAIPPSLIGKVPPRIVTLSLLLFLSLPVSILCVMASFTIRLPIALRLPLYLFSLSLPLSFRPLSLLMAFFKLLRLCLSAFRVPAWFPYLVTYLALHPSMSLSPLSLFLSLSVLLLLLSSLSVSCGKPDERRDIQTAS